MATTKKSKKKADTVVHEADLQGNLIFASPLDLQEHIIDPAPETAMHVPTEEEMERYRKELIPEPVFEPEIPPHRMRDIEIERIMDERYGRYRHDLAGLLWSILRELVDKRVPR